MPIIKTRCLSQSVVTLGNFDGVHRGHQELIKTTVQAAQVLKLPSVVVTFEPQPKEYFRPAPKFSRLMRLTEKWLAVSAMGVEYLYCLRFDKKLASLSAEQFVKEFLVKTLGVKSVFIGPDFRFGQHRQGDLALLQHLGQHYSFSAQTISPIEADAAVISSTRIRAALESGETDLAQRLLGHPYQIHGRLQEGMLLLRRNLPLPLGRRYQVTVCFADQVYEAFAEVQEQGLCLHFLTTPVSLIGRKLTVNIIGNLI